MRMVSDGPARIIVHKTDDDKQTKARRCRVARLLRSEMNPLDRTVRGILEIKVCGDSYRSVLLLKAAIFKATSGATSAPQHLWCVVETFLCRSRSFHILVKKYGSQASHTRLINAYRPPALCSDEDGTSKFLRELASYVLL